MSIVCVVGGRANGGWRTSWLGRRRANERWEVSLALAGGASAGAGTRRAARHYPGLVTHPGPPAEITDTLRQRATSHPGLHSDHDGQQRDLGYVGGISGMLRRVQRTLRCEKLQRRSTVYADLVHGSLPGSLHRHPSPCALRAAAPSLPDLYNEPSKCDMLTSLRRAEARA